MSILLIAALLSLHLVFECSAQCSGWWHQHPWRRSVLPERIKRACHGSGCQNQNCRGNHGGGGGGGGGPHHRWGPPPGPYPPPPSSSLHEQPPIIIVGGAGTGGGTQVIGGPNTGGVISLPITREIVAEKDLEKAERRLKDGGHSWVKSVMVGDTCSAHSECPEGAVCHRGYVGVRYCACIAGKPRFRADRQREQHCPDGIKAEEEERAREKSAEKLPRRTTRRSTRTTKSYLITNDDDASGLIDDVTGEDLGNYILSPSQSKRRHLIGRGHSTTVEPTTKRTIHDLIREIKGLLDDAAKRRRKAA